MSAQPHGSQLSTLTHVDQIRQLTAEQAALAYPVRIRGVITMDAPAPDFFVQDSTAGVYVEGSASPNFTHQLGKLVELDGITGPGKFAPVVHETRLRIIGDGALPKAELSSFSQLANGQQDSQWALVRGIVRSAAVDKTSWRETALALRIASEGGEFTARVPITHEQDFSSWVDREVLIEGVCGSLYSADRQLTGILFYVPKLNFIKLEPPTPEVSVSALLRFTPGAGMRHRVRIRGIVEYREAGSALFLQVQGKGVRVLTQQSSALEIGDLVEVQGFPAMGDSAPMLEDAVFRRLSHLSPPTPTKLNVEAPWEQFDGALVSTEAKLISHSVQPDGFRLLLQTGDVLFDATLSGAPASTLLYVPVNSRVRVAGICLVRSGGLWQVPQSFRMLLRSDHDVTVLAAPPWWNLRHTVWVLAITLGVLLIVLAWVVVLGKRVRQQMFIIREKLRHGAVLEERNRIARELHDTLEQELAGITMQLDLANDCFQQAPGIAQHALQAARDMSRHSMVEARRSVWDLRCQLLEDGDLVSAISQILQPLTSAKNSSIDVKVTGTPLRLPGQIEMNLLRIAQEAVANALKHGHAQDVRVNLGYSADSVSLNISDNGQGFKPRESAPAGHFGLLDMRERAQSMGTQLIIESEVQQGTRVTVQVPLSGGSSDLHESSNAEFKADTYSGRG